MSSKMTQNTSQWSVTWDGSHLGAVIYSDTISRVVFPEIQMSFTCGSLFYRASHTNTHDHGNYVRGQMLCVCVRGLGGIFVRTCAVKATNSTRHFLM